MVAGKVKQAMGLSSKQPKPKPKPDSKPPSKPNPFATYLPRSSAQVQPRPPDISVPDLLHLVDELRGRESRLKTQLVELKLLRETASFVPSLEAHIATQAAQIERLVNRVSELEVENEKLVRERDVLMSKFDADMREKDARVAELLAEVEEFKRFSASNRFQGLIEVANKSNLIKNLYSRKSSSNSSSSSTSGGATTESLIAETTTLLLNNNNNNVVKFRDNVAEFAPHCASNSPDGVLDVSESSSSPSSRCRFPRVPKPPPKSAPALAPTQQPPVSKSAPPAPPPGPTTRRSPTEFVSPPPPPPPPVPAMGGKGREAKVKRVPEVVEFYHSIMRRDTRKDSGVGAAEVTAGTMTTTTSSARDLVGEIENRSAYLLAIKTDVETQGDFIKFLIKEVETASFTDIEDVVSFVKWLDDELSYLVDERAVLKHFDWPELKADGLREAAFEYSDLKKLESEASSFRHDARQACSTTLKKMQTLLEKLEHGAYNLSRLRESATNRFKSFHIPVDWMLDTGFVGQIKLASVKLAMKYMKRVLAELEIVGGGPEEEELIVQGVRFAFRVHQFAGGFDIETMTAFEELRDKARSFHVRGQNQSRERLACKSMP